MKRALRIVIFAPPLAVGCLVMVLFIWLLGGNPREDLGLDELGEVLWNGL